MKRIILTVCSLVALAAPLVHGQVVTVTGNELEIGPTGADQVMIINGASRGGAAIGTDNSVLDFYRGSLAVGISNSVYGGYAAAFGYSNTVSASASVAIGENNTFQFDPDFGGGSTSLIVGKFNTIFASSHGSIVSGVNNWVGGTDPNQEAMATFGRGLINIVSSSTVVGQYNNMTPLLAGSVLFVVGNGPDYNNRSNALEVYGDGTVIVRKRQGDILMGEFGN